MLRKTWGMRAHLLGGLLALAGACGGSDAGPGRPERAASAQAAPAPRPVRLAPVEERELSRTLAVTGSLSADDRVTVSTQVAGRLASIAVDLGTPVEAGQVIAQVDSSDHRLRVDQAASALAQARALLGLDPDGKDEKVDIEQTSTVKQAQATLDEASANLERSRTLVEQRLIARAEYDTSNATFLRAQTALENAREQVQNRVALLRQRRSELELAKKELADTQVHAPLTGVVEAKLVSPGEYLALGTPVATIVRVNPLRLRVEVPEREAASVRVGQTVRGLVDGQTEPSVGRVARLSPTLGEQSRTLVIEAEIENPGMLRPGAFVRAEIVLEGSGTAVVVPASAVITFAGIDKVLEVEGGKIVEKQVAIGRRTPDLVEVLKGVELGEHVVIEPGNLQQGQAVSVAER